MVLQKTLQVKKSIIETTPVSLLFGELSVSDKDNVLHLYVGDQNSTPVEIFNQDSISPFVYNNDKQKYVAPNGSDLNNGQQGFPFATIEKALSEITTGGMVSLEAGIYSTLLSFDATHSVRGITGLSTSNTYNSTEFSDGIEMYGANNRMTFANIEFSSSTLDNHIDINSSSSTQNYNFDHITVSGSTKTTSNIIRVANTGSGAGYININQCDFANRTVLLNNSGQPRFCFITNSRNMKLSVGTNWVVVVDDNSTFQEITNNNNIINSNIVNDIIDVVPTLPGVYILSADVTINTVLYTKGSLIFFSGVDVTFVSKYYLNKPAYYVISQDATFVKIGSLTYENITTYPIVL